VSVNRRPRVAAIVTEYRPASHADVIVGKVLGGYQLDGQYRESGVEVVALFTDQVPANDLSRGLAARYGVPIYGRIRDALTNGEQRLAVDGVLLIGEHGHYPFNAWGQHLYPRRRFLEEVIRVFEASDRVVPVFIDKHLSYDWPSARWMFDRLRAAGAPLLAGSSLPVALRVPPLELPLGCGIDEALVVGYGGVESYGFHGLEALQCMVERRTGGETGLAAVACLTGDRVWAEVDRCWSPALLAAARAACRDATAADPRQVVAEPVLFSLEYRDGLRAGVLLLNGYTEDWGFAARLGDTGVVVATNVRLERGPPYGHFARLVAQIESMMTSGREPYPPERTLLTTGALALLMESRYRGQRLTTPELDIAYDVANWPRAPIATGESVLPLVP
jgi:hypothetical protein